MPRRFFLASMMIATMLVASFGGSQPAAAQSAVADWTLRTADGGSVNFHEKLAEGPVLVSFWALWCNPCLKELPHINDIAADFAGELTVLSVNIDETRSVARVLPYIQSKGFTDITVPLDTNGMLQRQMQVGGVVPFLVLYDSDGTVIYKHTGYKEGDEEELRHEIVQLMDRRSMAGAGVAGATMIAAPFAPADPDWTLRTVDGGSANFYDALREGPVMISFWALWCNPCLKELPHLDQMAADFAGEATIFAVNIDESRSVARVLPYLQSKGFDSIVVPMDTNGMLQRQMQVGGAVPFVVLYDASGRAVYKHTGYKEGDEEEHRRAIEEALAAPPMMAVAGAGGGPSLADAVMATNQFEYSYSTETQKEIVENWLDVAYQFGSFRTGLMLNSQQPSEEGYRGTDIRKLFFEFQTGDFFVRAGDFYGMFGRGLLYNSYENRVIRTDTRLVGAKSWVRTEKLGGKVFTGSTQSNYLERVGVGYNDLDIRGGDFEYIAFSNFTLGASGLTYLPNLVNSVPGEIYRDWAWSLRAFQTIPHFAYYVEYGERMGYDYDAFTNDADRGSAFYGNTNFFYGPASLSVEHSDYKKYTIVRRADGINSLNKPPSLTRDNIYTLLNRAPHNLNTDDEVGWQAELNVNLGKNWYLLGNGSSIKNHEKELMFEEGYVHLEQTRIGDVRGRVAFDYQDSEGDLRQTVIGEMTYFFTTNHSLTGQFEQQHVRLAGGPGYSLGEYDQQWIKLEYEIAPSWAFAGIIELNNKYPEQRDPGEGEGPFPAFVAAYNIPRGGFLVLWVGERQAGQVCSGGVCKYEPAFEGIEFYGLFRF